MQTKFIILLTLYAHKVQILDKLLIASQRMWYTYLCAKIMQYTSPQISDYIVPIGKLARFRDFELIIVKQICNLKSE